MNEIPHMAAAIALVALVWLLAGLAWLADWTRSERARRELDLGDM